MVTRPSALPSIGHLEVRRGVGVVRVVPHVMSKRTGSTRAVTPHRAGRTRTLVNRGDVRGLWQQYGSRADGAPLPAFTAAGHRLAGRLAADLRRRGYRLGTRPCPPGR